MHGLDRKLRLVHWCVIMAMVGLVLNLIFGREDWSDVLLMLSMTANGACLVFVSWLRSEVTLDTDLEVA